MLCRSCGRYMFDKHRCIYCGKRIGAEDIRSFETEMTNDSSENENDTLQNSDNESGNTGTDKPVDNYSYSSCSEVSKRWRAERPFAKIGTVLSFVPTVAIVYLLVRFFIARSDGTLYAAFSGLANKSDYEMLHFFSDVIAKWILIALGSIFAYAALMNVFNAIMLFDLSKWIADRNIDCKRLIKSGLTDRKQSFISRSYAQVLYIQNDPGAKKFYVTKIILDTVFQFAFVYSVFNFFNRMAYAMYNGFEVLGLDDAVVIKGVLLSSYGIFMYAALIGLLVQKIVTGRIYMKKLSSVLSSL